ncbi:PaaI family thioesterase [Neobacillus niacini]|uniref:PaaI family thioesterase n=1 Tax=Neobacillus niacini TaxID=86668 RepID=UPI0021CB599F|nr:PaaI family thioesterase [Neobacillus niacini]MCM3764334.1 PaaI family thioesterase [Neobacillus niacini]
MRTPETKSTFFEYMGFNSTITDKFELALPLQEHLLQEDGTIHPGVFSTMLDITMGATVSFATNSFAATINLNCSFLDLLPKEAYHAETNILKEEGKYVTAEGMIYDQNRGLVAKGIGTFKTTTRKDIEEGGDC